MKLRVTASALNLRDAPSPDGRRLGEPLPKGTLLIPAGQSGVWRLVHTGDRIGWVHSAYVVVVEDKPAPALRDGVIPVAALVPYACEKRSPCPNHSGGRPDVRGIILHATADSGNERGSLEWMAKAGTNAGCHIFVSRDGTTFRLCDDKLSAHHAGASEWKAKGLKMLNRYTLGWEFANRNDGEPLTDAQYTVAAKMAAHYVRQGLDLRRDFLAHYHVSPKRKTDPKGFDWLRFNRMASAMLD